MTGKVRVLLLVSETKFSYFLVKIELVAYSMKNNRVLFEEMITTVNRF
jgi:hypothetical protein